MSKPTRKLTLIIAFVLVVIGIFWYLESANAPTTPTVNFDNANEDAAADGGSEPATVSGMDSATSPADTSDSAIDRDLSAIDQELKSLDADSTDIYSSLNDQPIEQES